MEAVIATVMLLVVFGMNIAAAMVTSGLPFYTAVVTVAVIGTALVGSVIRNM